MIHLWREYKNKRPVTECGRTVMDKEVTFKACDVTCPKCKGTRAFSVAAKNPFWGVPPLEDWEKRLFK